MSKFVNITSHWVFPEYPRPNVEDLALRTECFGKLKVAVRQEITLVERLDYLVVRLNEKKTSLATGFLTNVGLFLVILNDVDLDSLNPSQGAIDATRSIGWLLGNPVAGMQAEQRAQDNKRAELKKMSTSYVNFNCTFPSPINIDNIASQHSEPVVFIGLSEIRGVVATSSPRVITQIRSAIYDLNVLEPLDNQRTKVVETWFESIRKASLEEKISWSHVKTMSELFFKATNWKPGFLGFLAKSHHLPNPLFARFWEPIWTQLGQEKSKELLRELAGSRLLNSTEVAERVSSLHRDKSRSTGMGCFIASGVVSAMIIGFSRLNTIGLWIAGVLLLLGILIFMTTRNDVLLEESKETV